MDVYMSIAKWVKDRKRNALADLLYQRGIPSTSIDQVYWYHPEQCYDIALVNDANLVVFYLDGSQFHLDNGRYAFMGKGQYTELYECLENNIPFYFWVEGCGFCKSDHHVINDETNWKYLYGKVWLTPVSDVYDPVLKINFIQGQRNLLLL